MGYFNKLVTQISNDSFLTALTVGLIVAWISYRLARSDERNAVIRSLREELGLHLAWMGGDYEDGIVQNARWADKDYIVFKLSTVALDNAVSKGTNLFLNKNLVTALTYYRQKVDAFNQIVDSALQFQANSELWDTPPKQSFIDRMKLLTCTIHWYGIGSSRKPESAHNAIYRAIVELDNESNTKLVWLIWLLLGINTYRIRHYLIKYL